MGLDELLGQEYVNVYTRQSGVATGVVHYIDGRVEYILTSEKGDSYHPKDYLMSMEDYMEAAGEQQHEIGSKYTDYNGTSTGSLNG